MRIAVAALVLVALPARATAEGTYVSFGVGPTAVEDALASAAGDGARVRFGLGHRFERFAIEGFVAPEVFDDAVSGFGAGLDARYVLPVSPGFQAYVRGSASHLTLYPGYRDGLVEDPAWYGDDASPPLAAEYSGRGLGAGVGVQLRGSVRALGFLYLPMFFVPVGPTIDAAVFLDHGYDFYRLHAEGHRSLDARVTRWTIGFNVGTDF